MIPDNWALRTAPGSLLLSCPIPTAFGVRPAACLWPPQDKLKLELQAKSPIACRFFIGNLFGKLMPF
jgi:hypothetical protein